MDRSIGTSRGMKKKYARIPLCTKCHITKLYKHPQRELGICGTCIHEMTGLPMGFFVTMANSKPQEERIEFIRNLLKLRTNG